MLIILATLILGILGFVFAALLGLAAQKFHVEEDLRVSTIMAILPGANCGACGSAGCHDFAEKLIKGEVAVSGGTVGGHEVAQKIAHIMGVEGEDIHKKIATIHCGAKSSQRKKKAEYFGVKTCSASNIVDGGGLFCRYGCLGYGDCFCVCPFDAIAMKDGLPVVDPEKCTACGKCVSACPRSIISLRLYAAKVYVACSSHDKGADVRKICPVGCIACKICEKQVPEVFKVEDNLAMMDYSKLDISCDIAIEKCPTKCIVKS